MEIAKELQEMEQRETENTSEGSDNNRDKEGRA